MQFSLRVLDLAVAQTTDPEVLCDIILAIFNQMRLRLAGVRSTPTVFGFENASVGELEVSLTLGARGDVLTWYIASTL